MGILDTLTTILFLGIMSCTIAQEQIPSGSETTAEETSRINIDNTDGSAPFVIPINFDKIALKKDCAKNGGPTAYSDLEAGATNFSSNCIDRLMNSTEFEVDKIDALSNGKWDTVIAKYCGRLPAFIQCVNPLVDLVVPCLAPVDRDFFRSNNNVSIALMEYLCQNDGNRTASFFSNGGLDCTESKRSTLQRNCFSQTSGSNTQPADSPAWIQLSLTMCPVIESFGTCTVKVMRTCENPTPADVVESMFDFLKMRQSCPSIPAAETT